MAEHDGAAYFSVSRSQWALNVISEIKVHF